MKIEFFKKERKKGEKDLPTTVVFPFGCGRFSISRTVVHHLASSASIYGLASGRVFLALPANTVCPRPIYG